jgi:outer membrane protein, heavy metal efflux system
MKKRSITLLLTCLVLIPLTAQTDLEQVLRKIEINNKSIQAQQQSLEARKMAFKSDIDCIILMWSTIFSKASLSQPETKPIYWSIRPLIFQRPTAEKKNWLQGRPPRQNWIFCPAGKESCLKHNRPCSALSTATNYSNRSLKENQPPKSFYRISKRNLETGDGNILDVNKAKLQLIEINKDYQLNTSQINQLIQNLNGLNGGLEVEFTANQYPEDISLPAFEELYEELKSLDPMWRFYELESNTAKKQVEVMKAMALAQAGGRLPLPGNSWSHLSRVPCGHHHSFMGKQIPCQAERGRTEFRWIAMDRLSE